MPASKLPSPLQRLFALLGQDREDLAILLLYTAVSSTLGLALPLAAQALINTVANGVFLQPLVVLSLTVWVGLLFAGVVRFLEWLMVEILQQRVFVRTTLALTRQLPRLCSQAMAGQPVTNQVNRFFDTVIIQKSLAKVLLTVPSAFLQILVGLLFIGFYSPWLVAFDGVLVFSLLCLWGLGWGAVRTSLVESTAKYKVAHFLQELALAGRLYQHQGLPSGLMQQADTLASSYVTARKAHFWVVSRQVVANVVIYAFVNAGVLAIGGFLVLHGKLSLGQLVAAELMTILVLSSLDKLVQQLEPFYDLLTSVDKLGHLQELPEEPQGHIVLPLQGLKTGLQIEARGLTVTGSHGPAWNFQLSPGQRLALSEDSYHQQQGVLSLLAGHTLPQQGLLLFNGHDSRDIDRESLWPHVGWVSSTPKIISGTVEANLLLASGFDALQPGDATHSEPLSRLWWQTVLEETSLLEAFAGGPLGCPVAQTLQSLLVVGDETRLSPLMALQLSVARATLNRPALLLIDHALDGAVALAQQPRVCPQVKQAIERMLAFLLQPQAPWTLVVATQNPVLAQLVTA